MAARQVAISEAKGGFLSGEIGTRIGNIPEVDYGFQFVPVDLKFHRTQPTLKALRPDTRAFYYSIPPQDILPGSR
jgi:hypothetical protein